MAILHSCCFWRSVRKGSYASVIYTLTYFSISCISLSAFIQENEPYLLGQVDKPQGESFLERDMISSTTVIFNILLLSCAAFGILSSILAIIGLRKDKRVLLIPWILVMVTDILVELSHFIYLIIFEKLKFEPLTATLFTIDFFIMCLNVYCLLCVISQYQEYKAGRGGAPHNLLSCTDNVHYIAPTATTCLNNIRQSKNMLSPVICPHTHCSLIPEEPMNGSLNSALAKKKSNNNDKVIPSYQQRQSRLFVLQKKRVNFPDDSSKINDLLLNSTTKGAPYKCCALSTNQNTVSTLVTSTPTNGNNNAKVIMIDTLPEYSEDIISWQEQNQ